MAATNDAVESNRTVVAVLEKAFSLQKTLSVFAKTGNWRDGSILEEEKKVKSGRGAGVSVPASPGPTTGIPGENGPDTFRTARPLADTPSLIQCKHCKKGVLRLDSKGHIEQCLRVKKIKAQRKKEAREARERAKEAAKEEEARRAGDDGGDDAKGDDDSDIDDGDKKVAGGAKTTRKAAASKKADTQRGKKRKAYEADQGPKPKKKKEEPKPKAAKPKVSGPVDVEKQCGVLLPNGQPCARSLTCKSHSMGAKRAVVGRSLPYDMLLAAYQKKNQAKQQKAAIDANAPVEDDDEANGGPVDSDEETAAVMGALAQWNPQPVVPQPIFNPIRRQYHLARLHESLQLATNGGRINIFKVSGLGAQRPPDNRLEPPEEEDDASGEPDSAIPPPPSLKRGPFMHPVIPPSRHSVVGHA